MIKAFFRWRRTKKLNHPILTVLRANVCGNCEHFHKGWFRNYCSKCFCTISKKNKFWNKTAHPCESCPIGKWTAASGYKCGDKNA